MAVTWLWWLSKPFHFQMAAMKSRLMTDPTRPTNGVAGSAAVSFGIGKDCRASMNDGRLLNLIQW